MTWFKVDDGFYSHDKVVAIPRTVRAEAIGTWTLCGTWSADKERDGFVPAHMVDELGGTAEGAEALVVAKLWKRKTGGFLFVNWSEFQPTREEKAERRLAESQRKAAYRARKARESGGESEDVPLGQNRDDNTPVPDPTRPDPKEDSPNGESARDGGEVIELEIPAGSRTAVALPRPFFLSSADREWASAQVPSVNVDGVTAEFVAYWREGEGKGKRKKNWPLTWRNWLKREHARNVERGWKPAAADEERKVIRGGRVVG